MGCRDLLSMKIRFTTNIRSNTQKFSSVDELPPEIREIYERAMASGPSRTGDDGNKLKTFTKLVINGREVDPTKAMSEAEQKLYADVIELLKKAPATLTTASQSDPTSTSTPLPPASSQQPVATPVDTGWLTKEQWKLVLVVVVLAAVALAVVLALR
jgi:hypothetical protein